MLKTLIIGADAVAPDYIFEHLELYPNIAKLVEQGVNASYSAYVQKGYHGSYLSEMNWSSIYTGLNKEYSGDEFAGWSEAFLESTERCGLYCRNVGGGLLRESNRN